MPFGTLFCMKGVEKMYKNCYFYIESGYMNVSDEQQERFFDEITDLFVKNGWDIKVEHINNVCPEIRNGKSELYIHPQALSGYIDTELVESIESILKQGTQFKYRYFKSYEDAYDWNDARYFEYLEHNKENIENDLLKIFKTKRKNLYMDAGDFLAGPLHHISEKYKKHRLTCGSDNLEWKYVQELFKQMVMSGKILAGETKKGICFRTAKSEETQTIKKYLDWCQENDKCVNDNAVNEYFVKIMNSNKNTHYDSVNVLFGYSTFIKETMEEQKGQDIEDDELEL